jgi:hypothetical protein
MDTMLSDMLRLKRHQAEIANGTVSAGSVVIDLDVFKDRPSHLFATFEPLAMDRLDPERMERALGHGIVEKITLSAHAAYQDISHQQGQVGGRTVLTAVITMNQNPARHLPPPQ